MKALNKIMWKATIYMILLTMTETLLLNLSLQFSVPCSKMF